MINYIRSNKSRLNNIAHKLSPEYLIDLRFMHLEEYISFSIWIMILFHLTIHVSFTQTATFHLCRMLMSCFVSANVCLFCFSLYTPYTFWYLFCISVSHHFYCCYIDFSTQYYSAPYNHALIKCFNYQCTPNSYSSSYISSYRVLNVILTSSTILISPKRLILNTSEHRNHSWI